jgi:tripartite-type tricarboxylate transporter receptor subunit TctC
MAITKWTRRGVGAALLAPMLAHGQAAAWPSRPIRILVPWAPGGGIDIIARAMAARLSEALGQPVLVENKTGGGGIIGMGEAARAAPDGYTLLTLDNSYTMLPHTTANLPWDHARAFAPIALGGAGAFMLVVNAAAPFTTLRDLIAAAAQAPEKLSFGTGGMGSSPHFVMEAFQQAARLRMLHVSYRGGAEAMLAVVAGQVDCSMATISAARGQIAAGRLRALAIASETRSDLVPDVPSFTEAGFPGFTGGIWGGLAAPASTPKPILDRLEATSLAALRHDDLKRAFASQGLEPGTLGREGFGALIRDETARWGRVAAEAGIAKQ